MIKLNVQQNTEEWSRLRTRHIGASDMAVIMGCSPYKTPLMLWNEKKGLAQQEVNFAMQKGSDLEPYGRELFEDITGKKFPSSVIQSDKNPWMIASLDGMSDDGEILELKYCGLITLNNIRIIGKPPIHHCWQMQHQMYVSDTDFCHYFAYNPEYPSIYIRYEQDPLMIDVLISKGKEFWNSLQSYDMPDLDKRDAVSMRDNYQYMILETNLKALSTYKKEIDEEIEEIKNEMISLCSYDKCEGKYYRISKVERKGSIEYSSIPELNGIDLEIYRKPLTEYHKFDTI